MLFTSLEFLLLFMPIAFGVYYCIPKAIKNYWLLFVSLFFYAWGEPVFVLAMVFSIVINYMLALSIDVSRKSKPFQSVILIVDIFMNLGMLFVFKYLNFTTKTLHLIIPQTRDLFPETAIALPIGISFFTFQAISYVVDVYRGLPAQKNPFYLGLYISLFPQLIAGPIVRYSTVMNQITERKTTIESVERGILRFIIGFNKKVLLANVLSEAADIAFGRNGGSAGLAWFGAICYSLQIYFDFSGYSDMAIGMGWMLGFNFLENFNYPYISQTITEFWRRWHISLGTWFRDYVYFPLGGSRVKQKSRLIFNLLTVWLLTGIWHGADWTFIMWGLLYGVIIIIEKLCRIPEKIDGTKSLMKNIYRALTLTLIMLGWVLFRSESISSAIGYIKSMFNIGWISDDYFVFYSREYIVYLIMGILCATPFFKWCGSKICGLNYTMRVVSSGVYQVVQLGLFIVSLSCLIMKANNPFIYFNF